ncbi:Aldose 1-epimerase [Klebsiella spallanzanii]|uniref:Aldose 1-epimerase n=1 Tax=Klebsiella spallanzanii TaxID=2587528 RepID=A0ABY6VEX4_9ENTR|nr:aldose 1-epimerase [Klebsiella spallanzanii]VUS53144.1 Aldose 1-epimerase [Klebsiella spallanzanii]
MAEELIMENAHLRMRVSPLGGKVQSLFSRQYQASVLYENPAGGMFPMLPLANRVAGNRFIFQGREILLPHHHADAHFFLHGDGWLQRWDIIERDGDYCVLQLRRQHACGFDYQAQIRYQLLRNQLVASLMLTHCGEKPMPYGCGFHPFFAFDRQNTAQFQASGYWPEGKMHLPLDWQGFLPGYADFSLAQYGEERWLNVGYSGWSGRAKVVGDVMSVTILSQTPWLMLFRMQGEPFLCLEPQSHPVNAHNMDGQPGLRVLGMGDSLDFSLKISVQGRE